MSKIVVLNMLPKSMHKGEIDKLILKSSLIAYAMLIVFAFGGKFILEDLFQISIESLQLAGGIVLAIIGFRALDKGMMFGVKNNKSLMDMAIVPLASPLTAGPATIVATIFKSATIGPVMVSVALFVAIAANMLFSLLSLNIKSLLDKYNLSGAIIRITGLFIMAIGVHMGLTAIQHFISW